VVSASDFIEQTDSETLPSVRWGALATATFGGLWLAFSRGLTKTVTSAGDAWASIYATTARVLAGFVGAPFAGLATAISTSWDQLQIFVAGAGIAGSLAAIMAVLLVLYILAQGVSEIGD